MDCKLQVPFGILCLTLLYLAFVLPIAFLSPVECLDGPCNSEGLDNSVLGWATDFLIALLMALFGLHLFFAQPLPHWSVWELPTFWGGSVTPFTVS